MGIIQKINDFIAPAEDQENLELTEEESAEMSRYENPVVKGGSKISANTNIVLFEPRDFNEAEEIAHHIKMRRACAINLHRMSSLYSQRLIDFLSGVMYAVDGSMKRIGDKVILCAPKTMPVSGDITLTEGSEEITE